MNSDLKMNLNNIEYLIKNGEENFANKKYPEAIAAFFAVKLLDPNNEKVDYILGESYYFINQPKKAEPILIRILKKYPDNFDLRSHLAKVLELNKKWRLAAKEHEKLLENENENLEIIDKLIFFYENNKNYNRLADLYRRKYNLTKNKNIIFKLAVALKNENLKSRTIKNDRYKIIYPNGTEKYVGSKNQWMFETFNERISNNNQFIQMGYTIIKLKNVIKSSHKQIIEIYKKINKEEIIKMYTSGKTLKELSDFYQVPIRNYFIQNSIKFRTCSENSKLFDKYKKIREWRKIYGSWTKGKTINDLRIKTLLLRGRIGMKGPTHGNAAYRKDLGHYVRSSWEANFARILKIIGLEYEYEKYTFILKDGRTYTPDFYIKNKDKFYEVKGFLSENDKCLDFIKEFPQIKFAIVGEKFYSRLIKHFLKNIIDDKTTFYTSDELLQQYKEFTKKNKFNKCDEIL